MADEYGDVRRGAGAKGLLGIVHYALFPASGTGEWDPTGSLEMVLDDDVFGAVEITWIKSGEVRRRAAKILADSGKQVMFSGGPPLLNSRLSLCSLDSTGRMQAVDFAKSLVDMAYELGARNLLISSGPDPGEVLRDPAVLSFQRSLEDICLYAAEQNPDRPLVICLEPFDRAVQFRQLIGGTRLAAEVVRQVRNAVPNCGITLDMSHVAQLGEQLSDAVRDAGTCLVHAHIANCVLKQGDPLYGDMHPPFDVPGGVYRHEDISLYLSLLETSGYFTRPCLYGDPVVSFEIKPTAEIGSDRIFEECRRFASQHAISRGSTGSPQSTIRR